MDDNTTTINQRGHRVTRALAAALRILKPRRARALVLSAGSGPRAARRARVRARLRLLARAERHSYTDWWGSGTHVVWLAPGARGVPQPIAEALDVDEHSEVTLFAADGETLADMCGAPAAAVCALGAPGRHIDLEYGETTPDCFPWNALPQTPQTT